jgi:hypothetical protein
MRRQRVRQWVAKSRHEGSGPFDSILRFSHSSAQNRMRARGAGGNRGGGDDKSSGGSSASGACGAPAAGGVTSRGAGGTAGTLGFGAVGGGLGALGRCGGVGFARSGAALARSDAPRDSAARLRPMNAGSAAQR